jgi:hypothetical protein
MYIHVRLAQRGAGLHELAVLRLKHLEGDNQSQQSACDAEVGTTDIEEAQDLLPEDYRSDQEYPTADDAISMMRCLLAWPDCRVSVRNIGIAPMGFSRA